MDHKKNLKARSAEGSENVLIKVKVWLILLLFASRGLLLVGEGSYNSKWGRVL